MSALGTVRRTITLPSGLDAAAEAAVDAGNASSVSALIAKATRDYLQRLGEESLVAQARRLDRDAEAQLVAQHAPQRWPDGAGSVRGDIWQPTASAPTGLAAWLEISADALAGAPTVTVAAVTTEPVRSLGWPLAIPIPADLLGRTAWIRSAHIHTLTRGELGQRVGRLPLLVVRRIDDALRRVLGINTIES